MKTETETNWKPEESHLQQATTYKDCASVE